MRQSIILKIALLALSTVLGLVLFVWTVRGAG